MITEEQVLEALKDVKDPELNRSLVELNMIRNIKIKRDQVSLEVVLTVQGCPLKAKIEEDVIIAVKELGASKVNLKFESMTDWERQQLAAQLRGDQGGAGQPGQAGAPQQLSPLLAPDSNTEIIAVTSGKGGVGKSTVSVNLAVSLARLGHKVGIIDADIYGFSIPDMIGVDRRPVVIDNMIIPVERKGVKVMSMGFFVENNAPVIWRGPMLGKMLRNFLSEVHWGELDYLILDLPPGTGDVALDVHQLIPRSKEIIVTTPHATAAFVAARAGSMAIQTNHEIIGVVENMSYYQCSSCGNKDFIFGSGGGYKLAEELKTKLLAQIPLGLPDVSPEDPDFAPSVYDENTSIGEIYMDLARKVESARSKTTS